MSGKRREMNWDKKRGARIRTAREMNNLTQRQLADRVGCAQSNISLIEKGRVFSLSLALKIMEVLGIDEDYLRSENGYWQK